MPRRSRREEDDEEEGEYDIEAEEEERRGGRGSRRGGGRGKRSRVESFIDDAASEDEDADEDDDEDEEYGGGRGRGSKRRPGSFLIDDMAVVDNETEEEPSDAETDDGFIVDDDRVPDENMGRSSRPDYISNLRDELEIDHDELERQIRDRYERPSHADYGEEAPDVEQQALLPSVKDPKLWMVKCAIGHERETAACLMQKFIDRQDLQITSVVALEHLKNYIYVEAHKESHVKEACKGLRNILASAKITLVPIKEMADVLCVESKSVDLAVDSWVRMKLGAYKGDLAKVVDVDNVRRKVTVKLIPRIDLQLLANKLDGREAVKKKSFVPPPRFFSVDEAREMHIRVERRRNKNSGEYFDIVGGLMFKDGFLHKTFSIKSISTQNVQPSFDELEKFRRPGDDLNEDVESLSSLFSNRRKRYFMKGDAVIVIKGDLKHLKGSVEKVEDGTVHIRPKEPGLPETLSFSETDLCKYFKTGDHVKVVSGVHEGATGLVIEVEGRVLIIVSDTTNEHIRVFADSVVESSEVTTGITRIGDYELHDLILLNNSSFGIILRVESEAFQVLKGVPGKPELVLVKLREIKCKIYRRASAKDRLNNIVSTKDIVKIIEGACDGRQGSVEHIHRGILFVYDRLYLEHSGFICVKAESCHLVGGSSASYHGNAMVKTGPQLSSSSAGNTFQSSGRLPPRGPRKNSGGRFGGRAHGGRGHDALVNRFIRIKSGPNKGLLGRVKEVTGALVRIELEPRMETVTVKREDIGDTATVATPFRETRCSRGGETPMHPSRTPLHPIQTPMRDPGATPIRDGMRTPMPSRAWVPMSPARDNWEDGNAATWATSPTYQPGSGWTPRSRPYEAPTRGSGWASTTAVGFGEASANASRPYVPSTPAGQAMTPDPISYSPATPGGQPLTPGNAGMDVMSPLIGAEGEGNWLTSDVWVNVSRDGYGNTDGVVKEVLQDGSCLVALGSMGSGGEVIAAPNEVEVVRPKKNDRVKIMNGSMRGAPGTLIGVDGSDGIVRVEGSLEVKIVDMMVLGKVAA